MCMLALHSEHTNGVHSTMKIHIGNPRCDLLYFGVSIETWRGIFQDTIKGGNSGWELSDVAFSPALLLKCWMLYNVGRYYIRV